MKKETIRVGLKQSVNYQTYGSTIETEIFYNNDAERDAKVNELYAKCRKDINRQKEIDKLGKADANKPKVIVNNVVNHPQNGKMTTKEAKKALMKAVEEKTKKSNSEYTNSIVKKCLKCKEPMNGKWCDDGIHTPKNIL